MRKLSRHFWKVHYHTVAPIELSPRSRPLPPPIYLRFSLMGPFILIYRPLSPQNGFFPSDYPAKFVYTTIFHLSSIMHVPSIQSFFIAVLKYLVNGENCGSLHYIIFSISSYHFLLSLRSIYSPQHLFSNTRFSLRMWNKILYQLKTAYIVLYI